MGLIFLKLLKQYIIKLMRRRDKKSKGVGRIIDTNYKLNVKINNK